MGHISILGPNLPESIVLGQDHQLQVLYSKTLNFIKNGAHFSFGTKFRKFVILGQGHQFQLIY